MRAESPPRRSAPGRRGEDLGAGEPGIARGARARARAGPGRSDGRRTCRRSGCTATSSSPGRSRPRPSARVDRPGRAQQDVEQVFEDRPPAAGRAVVERVVHATKSRRSPPSSSSGSGGPAPVGEDVGVVAAQRADRGIAGGGPARGGGQGRPLDVQEIQPAATARLEEAELRLCARSHREGAQRAAERQRFGQRAEDGGQRSPMSTLSRL